MVDFEPTRILSVGYRPGDPALAARVELIPLSVLRATDGHKPSFRRPQRPGFDLLFRIVSGELTQEVDFAAHRVGPGEVLHVHAGQVQRWGDLSAVEGHLVLFLPELLTPAALDVLRSRITAPRSYWARNSVPAETLALLDLLAALQNSRTDAAALTSERVLEAALLSLEDAPEPPEPRTAPSPAVSRSGAGRSHLYAAFLRLLESPALFQRSVHEFAHHLGCTPKTLTLAVHEHGGRTAKQAIDARLVLEAKRLLAYQADASVARIASELGFDDPANFSKFFRRNVGASPGGWRRTMIAAEAARDRS